MTGAPSVSPSRNHAPAGLSDTNNSAVADLVADSTAIPNTILPAASAFAESNFPPTVPVKPPKSRPSIVVIATSITIGVVFLMIVAIALIGAAMLWRPSTAVVATSVIIGVVFFAYDCGCFSLVHSST
ncbi:hypothetical protein B0H16DRAFT_1537300 [Mycena metata]|uniref:Transmembrane protein n=1 Tax=Mycena metata TaxID=1033252 RepID=A0AAD7J788_9AGAR|nr:hypothetical protein B0H16DRAFT_1537300 [Mycena metata]